jgi:hypothetical protein
MQAVDQEKNIANIKMLIAQSPTTSLCHAVLRHARHPATQIATGKKWRRKNNLKQKIYEQKNCDWGRSHHSHCYSYYRFILRQKSE